jgi:hypothetical protein
MLRKKSLLAAACCSAAIVLAGAGVASAGEYNAHGDPTGARTNSNSICSYSGLNDDPLAPTAPPLGPNGPGGRTQNFGQDVVLDLADPRVATPGTGDFNCRGGSNFNRE